MGEAVQEAAQGLNLTGVGIGIFPECAIPEAQSKGLEYYPMWSCQEPPPPPPPPYLSYPGRCKNVDKTSPRRDGGGERGAVPRRAKRHFIGSEEAEAGKRDVLAAMR